MPEETTKTMNDVVKEVKNRKTETTENNDEATLLNQFAMAALTGYLASNNPKDAARKSFILAQEMIEVGKQALKGKLKS